MTMHISLNHPSSFDHQLQTSLIHHSDLAHLAKPGGTKNEQSARTVDGAIQHIVQILLVMPLQKLSKQLKDTKAWDSVSNEDKISTTVSVSETSAKCHKMRDICCEIESSDLFQNTTFEIRSKKSEIAQIISQIGTPTLSEQHSVEFAFTVKHVKHVLTKNVPLFSLCSAYASSMGIQQGQCIAEIARKIAFRFLQGIQ